MDSGITGNRLQKIKDNALYNQIPYAQVEDIQREQTFKAIQKNKRGIFKLPTKKKRYYY